MARLSLLLPAWKTCSPRIEEPYRRVTGSRRMWEARWTPLSKVWPRVSARNTAAGTTIPGIGGQDLIREEGHPPRAPDPGG